jgi:hypothetical protein
MINLLDSLLFSMRWLRVSRERLNEGVNFRESLCIRYPTQRSRDPIAFRGSNVEVNNASRKHEFYNEKPDFLDSFQCGS